MSAFGETLHFITDLKLRELEKQRTAFESHAQILEDVKTTTSLTSKVEKLVKAIRDWTGSGSVGKGSGQDKQIIEGKLDLDQLDLWISQSKKDPCFSQSILEGWVRTLEAHIRHNSTRFEYAKLFGNLLNEWIASGDSVTGIAEVEAEAGEAGGETEAEGAAGSSEEFVDVGRKELVEQKERLQSLIFEPAQVDIPALKSYLEDLFSSPNAKEILRKVRDQIKQHGYDLRHKKIDVDAVRWTIESALSSDLMSEGKRVTLRQMASNDTVLEELASVLNMRLADLESWAWPKEGVEVDMRRALNGKYRAYTDPDIVDGLFLEYLGIMWQISFKKAFELIFNSRAWTPSIPHIPRDKLQERRQFIARGENFDTSLEILRTNNRKTYFFMSQLASNTQIGRREYDGDDDDGAERGGLDALPAIQIKQRLIHMMMTDCHLNTALHKSHTVVRSDFEWFGPSLPHDTILTVLDFFGISKPWLDFFKTFLETPTRFKEEDLVRTRRRGTPINYAISQLHGEVVLFALDYAVNQRADGLYLYRLHDDLWLWDPKPQRVETAWSELQRFTSLTGLALNKEKTGAACVGGTLSSKLPRGDVRWGFLKFDASKSRFVIHQDDIKLHIKELQRQLAATKSIFGWVNAYNKYMAFFRRNFGGRPPACFGQAHIDDIIETFAYIQQELFPNHSGGAVGYLRSLISSRMGVDDIPEGYFYFPITQGGLELRNPMIEAFALRRSDAKRVPKELENPDDLLEPADKFLKEMEKDHDKYRHVEEVWAKSSNDDDDDDGRKARRKGKAGGHRDDDKEKFMSFEEYVQYREQLLGNWRELYIEMLRVPRPRTTTLPPVFEAMDVETNNFYDDWVVALYGDGLVEKFGSLKLVDASLIPVGMVDLFKTSRMKWDQ